MWQWGFKGQYRQVTCFFALSGAILFRYKCFHLIIADKSMGRFHKTKYALRLKFALSAIFFPHLASCICALRPTYCIFSQIFGALYAMHPTFMKSTPCRAILQAMTETNDLSVVSLITHF
jgi:hypothetical protein